MFLSLCDCSLDYTAGIDYCKFDFVPTYSNDATFRPMTILFRNPLVLSVVPLFCSLLLMLVSTHRLSFRNDATIAGCDVPIDTRSPCSLYLSATKFNSRLSPFRRISMSRASQANCLDGRPRLGAFACRCVLTIATPYTQQSMYVSPSSYSIGNSFPTIWKNTPPLKPSLCNLC